MDRPTTRVNGSVLANCSEPRCVFRWLDPTRSLTDVLLSLLASFAHPLSGQGQVVRLIGKVVSVSIFSVRESGALSELTIVHREQLDTDQAILEASDGVQVTVKLTQVSAGDMKGSLFDSQHES